MFYGRETSCFTISNPLIGLLAPFSLELLVNVYFLGRA